MTESESAGHDSLKQVYCIQTLDFVKLGPPDIKCLYKEYGTNG